MTGWMISLVVDGVIAGVGGILTFIPNIFILFLALAILEDSGYMARVAMLWTGLWEGGAVRQGVSSHGAGLRLYGSGDHGDKGAGNGA